MAKNFTFGEDRQARLQLYIDRFNAIVDERALITQQKYMPHYDYKTVSQNIYTRADYRRFLARMERVFKNPEKELKLVDIGQTWATRFDITNLQQDIRRINKARKAERQRIREIQEKLEKGGFEPYNMQAALNEIEDNLKPIEFNTDKRNITRFRRYKEYIEKQAQPQTALNRKENYRINYLNAFKEAFADVDGFEDTYAELQEMDADDFEAFYYADLENNIDFIYDPSKLMIKFDTITENLHLFKQAVET